MVELRAFGGLGRFDSWHRMVASFFRPYFPELASNYLAAILVVTPPLIMAWYWFFRIVLPTRKLRREAQKSFLKKIEMDNHVQVKS